MFNHRMLALMPHCLACRGNGERASSVELLADGCALAALAQAGRAPPGKMRRPKHGPCQLQLLGTGGHVRCCNALSRRVAVCKGLAATAEADCRLRWDQYKSTQRFLLVLLASYLAGKSHMPAARHRTTLSTNNELSGVHADRTPGGVQ